MKTYIYKRLVAGSLILGLVGATSCSDFLKETPYTFVGLEQLEDTQASADQLVTGVYSKWNSNLFQYNYLPFGLELDADYISGPGWLLGAHGAGNFQGDEKTNAVWNEIYNLVERCNVAMEHISLMKNLTPEAKSNAIGELQFNKAFAYFLLVRAYGDVPLHKISARLAQSRGEEVAKPRSEVSEVYAEIISLLEQAIENLYSISQPSYRVGHVAKGSAVGLLMKVYANIGAAAMPEGTEVPVMTGPAKQVAFLNVFNKKAVAGYEGYNSQECYAKVLELGAKLIAGEYGTYKLLPYEDLWKLPAFSIKDGAEYMFSVYAKSGDAIYGNMVSRYYSYTESDKGEVLKGLWLGNRSHWYDLFEPEDKRITEGVLHRWQNLGKDFGVYYPASYIDKVDEGLPPYNDGLKYNPATGAANLAFVTKYFNVTDRKVERSDATWSFLRYADILLLYAEALNENQAGDAFSSEAIDIVKQIRERSLATADHSDLDNATTKTELRRFILQERAKELACEADRRWDLIRWGIYLDAMNVIGVDESGIPKSRMERNLLYPIPTTEVLANPYITTNNPGWN